MTNDEKNPDTHTDTGEQAERVDPATNTAPPSNPETDGEAVDKGKEKLDQVVSW